jgi:hypothetical protein
MMGRYFCRIQVNFLTRWLSLSLPFTVIIFLLVTMRTTRMYPTASGVGFEDPMTMFGFPLGWYSPMYGSSGAYGVAIVPLVIDLLLYALFVTMLQWVITVRSKPLMQIPARALTAISLLAWIIATLLVSTATFVLTRDLIIRTTAEEVFFPEGENAVYRRAIVFGVLPESEEKEK